MRKIMIDWSKAHQGKLKDKEVWDILFLYNTGTPVAKIAIKYEMSKGSIYSIIQGKTYKHVKRDKE